MTKLFISQPMKDKTDEEIEIERERIVEEVEKTYGEVEVVDSFFKGVPHDANPLWYLGESIKKLSEADVVAFGYGWEEARGCNIEFLCATEYGLNIVMR